VAPCASIHPRGCTLPTGSIRQGGWPLAVAAVSDVAANDQQPSAQTKTDVTKTGVAVVRKASAPSRRVIV
jgi:hypothetical protein